MPLKSMTCLSGKGLIALSDVVVFTETGDFFWVNETPDVLSQKVS